MQKVDRRVRRTKRLLREALIALILEKDYEVITIKEVTERADVAYVTFFRHYDSLDELLLEGLAESLNELQARIDAAAQGAQVNDRDIAEGRLIFDHARENSELYQVLLKSPTAYHIRYRMKDTIASLFQKGCEPLRDNDNLIPGDIAASHIASSILALIEWWLEHDMPYRVERMAQIYHRLIVSATLSALSSVSVEQAK